MSSDPNTVNIFVSFSQEDSDLKIDLTKNLKILKRQNMITDWFDRDEIEIGAIAKDVVSKELSEADIILLLVSADYLANDTIWDEEIDPAMKRHEDSSDPARVIPVILRQCNWQSMSFGKLMAAPKNGHPIALHPHPDVAYTYITTVIKSLADKIKAFKQKNPVSEQLTSETSIDINNPSPDAKEMELESLLQHELDLVKMLMQWRKKIPTMAEGSEKYYLQKEIDEKAAELENLRIKIAKLK
ncbi:MAG: toll/interleukin-1 receptor domain-containing protein [Bacteroidota bacterium]